MKKTVQKSVTVFMALLLLVGSTGLGLIEHHCMMRGKSIQLSSTKIKSCKGCKVSTNRKKATENQSFFKKVKCCQEQSRYEKLEVLSSSSQLLTKFIKTVAEATFYESRIFFFAPIASTITQKSFVRSLSFSSLHHGRSMLCFIQSFLI